MANIVEAVKNELTGDLLENLTASIGESVETVKSAANAATPALLSALAGLAMNQLGADKLASILEGFSGDSPGRMRDDILEGRGDAVQRRGEGVLGSLLGGGLSILVDALAKFSGASPESVKRLLGYVAPMVLSLVATRVTSKGGLSAASLSSFFEEQKSNITGAVPPALSLAGLPTPLHNPAYAAGETESAGKPYWMGSLLVVVALALAAAYFFLQQPPAPPVDVDQTETTTVPREPQRVAPSETKKKADEATQSAPAGPSEPAEDQAKEAAAPTASEVIKSLGDAHVIAIQALASINNVETAEAQLPTLAALGAKLDQVKGRWDKLSAADKQTVAKSSAENREAFKSLAEKSLKKPEIADKLKSVLDALVDKMDIFTA